MYTRCFFIFTYIRKSADASVRVYTGKYIYMRTLYIYIYIYTHESPDHVSFLFHGRDL